MTEQITKLSQLNWAAWIVGIWGALVSGLTASIAVGAIDPGDFNLHTRKLYAMFLVPAVVSIGKYLYLHTMPDPLPQATIANVKTVTTITPTDPDQPATKVTTSTPVTGPALVPDVQKEKP